MDVNERISEQLKNNKIMLYMKGSPQFPMCGFSGRAVQILTACGAEFGHVNVLEDDEIREGIKQYSNWPTIPQLYINGEFIGGSDIMMEMYERGEMQQAIDEVMKAA
ncbi:MAG: Grx4 family monothiol glutaredoxin [Gammaproteobacteria bacterium]|nr:MAG: Grx4 family monothiol glutaredoxin [Gammaproteobacteria bacterium]